MTVVRIPEGLLSFCGTNNRAISPKVGRNAHNIPSICEGQHCIQQISARDTCELGRQSIQNLSARHAAAFLHLSNRSLQPTSNSRAWSKSEPAYCRTAYIIILESQAASQTNKSVARSAHRSLFALQRPSMAGRLLPSPPRPRKQTATLRHATTHEARHPHLHIPTCTGHLCEFT
jgi:hypothetical protein